MMDKNRIDIQLAIIHCNHRGPCILSKVYLFKFDINILKYNNLSLNRKSVL